MKAVVPRLLEKLRTGDNSVVNKLVPALYDELHRIAARRLRGERPGHTLQTTALVHEAYVKLSRGAQQSFKDRAHFLAIASRVMRQVLMDYARARASRKRRGNGNDDGDRHSAAWTTNLQVEAPAGEPDMDLLALDRALEELASEDPALAQLMEMRFYGGMTANETAEILGCSVHVVRHDLRLAQAWLRRRLAG